MLPNLLAAVLFIVGAYAFYVASAISFYTTHWRELQYTLERQKQAQRWKHALRKL